MNFIKLLFALLVLWFFKQADTQTVTVTIGESAGSKVFMEWEGSFKALPPTLEVDNFLFFSNLVDINQIVLIATSAFTTSKSSTDFMVGCCQFSVVHNFLWISWLQATQTALISMILLP